jgi:hypothetical protein
MGDDFDILPPKMPGENEDFNLDNYSKKDKSIENKKEEKKEGFFSRLFGHKKEKVEENKELPNFSDMNQENNFEKEFDFFESNEKNKQDSIDDSNENPQMISDDIKYIREKLGLNKENESSQKYFEKLEQNKNLDLEKESNRYDELQDDSIENKISESVPSNTFFNVNTDENKLDDYEVKKFNNSHNKEFDNLELQKFKNNVGVDSFEKHDFTQEHLIHQGKEQSNFVHEEIREEDDLNEKFIDDIGNDLDKYLDSNYSKPIQNSNILPEKIDDEVDLISFTPKESVSQVSKLDSKYELPMKEIPKDIDSDPRIYLQATNDVKKDLGKIEIETRDLIEDVKNILLEKKRKLLNNIYVTPNGLRLKSILTLKEFTKSKEMFQEFNEEVLKDKAAFTKWVKDVLTIQYETEKALEVELYSKVNALYDIYLQKVQDLIAKYQPVKIETLNKFKQKEFNLNNKIKYLEQFELDLKKAKADVLSLENKYKKGLETIEQKKQELLKQKESIIELDKKRKVDLIAELKLKEDKFTLEISKEKELLKKQKDNFEEEKRKIKTDILEIKDKYFALKGQVELEYSQIHPTYLQMNEDKKIFDSRKQLMEKKLKEQEDNILQKIMYNESLLAAIAKEKNELLSLKEDVDKGGFKNYLDKALANMPEDDVMNAKEDKTLTHSKTIEPGMSELDKLFDLIATCRKNLETNNYSQAKKTYNELRTFFMYASLTEEQKQDIYTQIRELYDDINIKLLEQQAIYHL